jgi:hypothetical protein
MTEKYNPTEPSLFPGCHCTIAAQSALESYGVVGIGQKYLASTLQVLVKDPMRGLIQLRWFKY